MNWRDQSAMALATGFHIGYLPVAPGTFGALLGLPLWLWLQSLDPLLGLLGLGLAIAAAVWASWEAERITQTRDPGCIVIDEIVGMAVTLMGLPPSTAIAFFGFLVFRTLDIWKPPPIRQLERRLKGGVGVVVDDVVAGIFGNVFLRLVIGALESF